MMAKVAQTQSSSAYHWRILQVTRFDRRLVVCALMLFMGALIHVASAQGRAPTLDNVLSQLDSSARTFHSVSANVERTKVTIVVNDHSTENGTLLVKGDKMLLQMAPPDQRTILRTGDNIYLYTPGLKQVEEYNLGKNRDLADEFLLLGFGSSGEALDKGFQIKLIGEENVGDKKDIELELTPRTEGVRNQISKVQMWLDQTTWLADELQLTESGSGDYSTVRYTKVVRNPNISDSQFKPHWPKGTEKIKP
jgi:outer membrane lipoprotein-sorting protein